MTTPTYDALGFDPAPGVPASVHQLVASLTGVTRQLHDAHATLTRLGKTDGAWVGEAASAFAKKTGSLPKYLATAHSSLLDATHALADWETRLREFQTLAGRYELEAEQARKALKAAQNDPDLQLAGRTFDTQAEADRAQQRLDHATRRVNQARDELVAVIKKAEALLTQHDEVARAAAAAIRKAAEAAPDESLLHKLGDLLSSIGDRIKDLANDLWHWIQKHADTIYKIGDWLGYASAVCDVLAVVFSETLVGAVFFEILGRVLNAGALTFHGVGWAAGAKKGNALDIGLDLAGFVPFGDLLRAGKIARGAFKGVKIPMRALDFGAKAADSWKRASDLIEHVGGTAKLGEDAEEWVMRNAGALGRKAQAIHITADTFKDRFELALAKELGDRSLYKAGTKLSDIGFQKVLPRLIENTPLGRIPGLADSVRPIIDDSGRTVGHYIDPRSWTARGYEAVTSAKNLYKEGVRVATEDVRYGSEKIHEKIDEARETAGHVVSRLADANPFG
ncbi:putative T7SS-secreted protein [Streptomyces sp. NPDC007251]|uniref:putative T7SS-secreted protein n=1 Tax=Streptomyces sp. NPDC007251 TaxID=3154483 RepID=UPI0033E64AA8